MSRYAQAITRPVRTILDADRMRLLKVTGEHRNGFRDHVILSLGFGTGLRQHEIAALNVGDVMHEDRISSP
jgi:site-specific recombinase XerC